MTDFKVTETMQKKHYFCVSIPDEGKRDYEQWKMTFEVETRERESSMDIEQVHCTDALAMENGLLYGLQLRALQALLKFLTEQYGWKL